MTAARALPIIDAHIHLFDPRRPQGVPWPPKSDSALYKAALPARYRRITNGLGVAGAIAVECSPWLADNDWVLEIAAKSPIIVGMVGDLDPGEPQFGKRLERLSRNPLFRGIRYGNLWGRSLARELSKPKFISGLKALADAGLELDTANPDATLVAAVVRLTDRVPELRVVVDHLPQFEPEPRARKAVHANLRELGKRPKVFVKISEVLRRVDSRTPYDLDFYRPILDELYGIFGEDHVIYGSDWPNSDHWGTYSQALSVVREYFAGKGSGAAEKFFWTNSAVAYRWRRRDNAQPDPHAG
ncbi:MAG: amidohydrolase family protein [Terriglobia bacterium]